MPPPIPPSVNAGRMIAGSPISSRNARASSTDSTLRAFGIARPIDSITFRNSSRSSAR